MALEKRLYPRALRAPSMESNSLSGMELTGLTAPERERRRMKRQRETIFKEIEPELDAIDEERRREGRGS